MSYTAKDVENAGVYANQRYLLLVMNTLYKKQPHLVSHLKYEITKADPNHDYYYPPSFEKKAIMVNINIPAKLCEKLSCNSIMAHKACGRDTPAANYNIGDSADYDLHCQPACFWLKEDPVIDEETGEEQVQMLPLAYNDEFKCVIRPSSYAWHQFPFYRSDTVYEHRLNDLPAGFNLGIPNPDGYSKETYKYNESYCAAYFDKWDPVAENCTQSIWETIAYAVVGESIVKMAKAGITELKSGGRSDYPPIVFPDIPKAGAEWTIQGWKGDVNLEFILPPVDFTFDDTFEPLREVDSGHTPVHVTPQDAFLRIVNTLKNRHCQIDAKIRRKLEIDIATYLEDHEIAQIKFIKSHNTGTSPLDIVFDEDAPDSNIIQILVSVLQGILASVVDGDFWVDVGIGVVSDVLLSAIKDGFRKLANTLIPKLTAKIIAIGGKVMSKVFAKSLITTVTGTVGKVMVKVVSKVMVKLAELAAEIASIVGIVIAILSIFDILLSIFDPLGFNKKFNKEILTAVTKASDTAMRKDLEVAVPEMTFGLFANLTLEVDELIDDSLHTYIFVYEYLNSLTVNSEGSRLDKGTEMDLGITDEDDVIDQVIAKTKLVTPKELYDFEYDHVSRMNFFQTTKKVSIGLLSAGCLFLIIDLGVVSVIFFILALIIALVTYINASTINMGQWLLTTNMFGKNF